MLRITPTDDGTQYVNLLLEGRVAGPWVAELRRVCDNLLAEGRPLRLDLTGVSFLEADGIETLTSLRSRGVVLTNCSPFVSELLKSAAAN